MASSVASLPVEQDLDGDLTTKLHVLRPVDDAHAAGAELIENTVVPDDLTDEGTGHDEGPPIVSPTRLDREGP